MFFKKKEKKMSINLLSSFESLTHASNFISSISSLVETVGADYVKDQNVRDALIDTTISYLQSLKTNATPPVAS